MMRIKLGITGGIGSGKSYVANLLKQQGIPVYNTDMEARRLMESSDEIRRNLISLCGQQAYLPDGSLNRKLVSSWLFSSPLHRQRVNDFVHPVVKDDFLQWVDVQTGTLVAMECAILFESGFDRLVDEVLLVRAPEEVSLRRVMQRDEITEVQVRARMAAQMSDVERCRRVHYIINNDGNTDVEDSLRKVLREISIEQLSED